MRVSPFKCGHLSHLAQFIAHVQLCGHQMSSHFYSHLAVVTTHWYIALTVSHGGAIISSHLQMTSEAMDLGFNTRCNQEPVMML